MGLGVARSTVWRWERGIHPIGAVSERQVRILAEGAEHRQARRSAQPKTG